MLGRVRRHLRILVTFAAAWAVILGAAHALHAQAHALASVTHAAPADHHYCPLCALDSAPALPAPPAPSVVAAEVPPAAEPEQVVGLAPIPTALRRGPPPSCPGRAPPALRS
jgi:hypothetical protein